MSSCKFSAIPKLSLKSFISFNFYYRRSRFSGVISTSRYTRDYSTVSVNDSFASLNASALDSVAILSRTEFAAKKSFRISSLSPATLESGSESDPSGIDPR